MLLKKWLPWKFILKKAAKTYGFLDPFILLARIRRFAQPSEVHEPIELMRAGVIFHARGLINTRVIQYNLDWVWPYWVEKQFRPRDHSFIPRGFSFSHVNLTHRNWTALGHPEIPHYPIVDPRGLVTPYMDGWSIDFWMLSAGRDLLIPAQIDQVDQHLDMQPDRLSVCTQSEKGGSRLHTAVWVGQDQGEYQTTIRVRGMAEEDGWLVMSLRPYNPEGVQFIDSIAYDRAVASLLVNGQTRIQLDQKPQKVLFSHYYDGDVVRDLKASRQDHEIACDMGMATAAVLFPTTANNSVDISVSLPLVEESITPLTSRIPAKDKGHAGWWEWLSKTARLTVPDEQIQYLYDAAVRTMLLLSAAEAYPGPYTYKRFWFRDACLMINALLGVGLVGRATRMIERFPERQTLTGYFQSQEGEWDSNGQVLWIAGRLHELTGVVYKEALLHSLFKGADWIINKRVVQDANKPHQGLLPAGFSAEHLGPNDHYYWDNFWGLAGLNAVSRLAGEFGRSKKQKNLAKQAQQYRKRIFDSIEAIPSKKRWGGIPASPYRRMDAGAIGSLVVDYPLQLTGPNNPLVMNTVSFLMENCFHSGSFFQDMIHAGINAYLTLAIGQTLLRAGDSGYRQLVQNIAALASPTGQWPEAIHPFTRGGCMGDGQHGWAAAEWLMMLRNMFVREEHGAVIVGSGILPEWIETGKKLIFGPTLVPGGRMTVRLQKTNGAVRLDLDCHEHPPNLPVVAAIPGYPLQAIADPTTTVEISSN
jgi:hypothetical protein